MSIRVLVVDDDEQIRRALTNALTRSGFAVIAVDDGPPALELVESTQLDCIIVDFNLRTTTGDTVVRAFRSRHGARLFCVVLSGEDDPDTRAACLRAGADDVMLKPASPRVLRARLAEAVAELSTAA